MVEEESHLRVEHSGLPRSSAHIPSTTINKARTLSLCGAEERRRLFFFFSRNSQTAWTASCRMILLKAKESVFPEWWRRGNKE